MATPDLLFGFFLSRLFAKPETRSPAVVFPPAGGGTTPAPTVPATVPTTPTAPFPEQVSVPTKPVSTTPPGFKKAVEVWIVQPSIARQANSVLVGAPAEVAATGAAITLQALEAQFPKGWQGARSATAEEAANAKSLLSQWRDGGVVFMGPPTLTGRRAYRMTRHPATATAPASSPAPAAQPPATVPASFPSPSKPKPKPPAAAPAAPAAPASTVTTLPEVLITADAPTATPAPTTTPAPSVFAPQVTRVRRGEGLANVAKRLGRPATAASALELRAANLPGPNGDYTSQDLSKGGLKKRNRAGGLQPGDPLFVPAAWAPVDAERL